MKQKIQDLGIGLTITSLTLTICNLSYPISVTWWLFTNIGLILILFPLFLQENGDLL